MEKNEAKILLSICIPTYNRCDILDKSLKKITDQSSFDQRVEIVISDNCSTDNTKDVVSKYQKLYNNIVYHCNSKNIFDENFTQALLLGSGEYLKLMNDTIILNDGAISNYLYYIEKFRKEKPLLLFYKNNEIHSNKTTICTNLNQFVDATSFYIGWVANFGVWKEKFASLDNKNGFSCLFFMQIDWSLRLFNKNQTIIIFNDWIDSTPLKQKGGYNFFEIHIDNYLFFYLHYLNNGTLNNNVFRKEKIRLLKYFLQSWIKFLIFQKDTKFFFITTGWGKIFWRNYKLYPSFYIIFCKQFLINIMYLIRSNRVVNSR